MLPATSAEIGKYTLLFEKLCPVDGKLDGEKCKKAMMKSQLSVETLGRVWDLSDIDNDGSLDLQEFILAMHLIHRCMDGDMLPNSLPPNLVPPGKDRALSHFNFPSSTTDPFTTPGIPVTMALVPMPKSTWSNSMGFNNPSQFSPLALSAQPFSGPISAQYTQNAATGWPQFGESSPSYVYPPWAISSAEMTKAAKVFSALDLDADGLLSGAEVRDVLIRSGLQQAILAQIWELVDVHGTGMLNCEQFAVAMHLATEQLASSPYSRPLPAVLPPSLVPPSLRPVPPDPAIFEESNKLIAEIEAINRERAEVEAAYATLNVESQQRATEMSGVQRTVDALSHTSRSLVNQRSEAERRLTDYAHERNTLTTILNELKDHVATERQKVEEVRSQINTQQVSVKSQEEEITRLRNDVNELIREEAILQDRLAENQRRMEIIEAENRVTQSRIDKTNNRVTVLESTRGELLDVLDQYTGLLNGTLSGPVPEENKVKSLLAQSCIEGSSTSFDSGLGAAGLSRAFGDFDWSAPNVTRGLGASSVPLPIMSTTNASQLSGDRTQAVSAMGMPISAGPFLTTDAFGSTDKGQEKAPFPAEKGFSDDPFGPSNLFSTSDPFKDIDPFGGDPFTLPAENSQPLTNVDTSVFDPFSTAHVRTDNINVAATNTITGANFDAVFGSSSVANGNTDNAGDPFGTDPFGSLELAAITGQGTQQLGFIETSATTNMGSKKSPPPRPKTQPGAGRVGRERKSLGGSPEISATRKSPNSFGNFSSFTHSKSTGFSPFGSSKQKSPSSFATRVHGPSSSSRNILTAGRTKKERDQYSHSQNRSKSFTSSMPGKPFAKSTDAPEWAAPIGLSEEEQLSLATMESRQLAQAEEQARKQEQADLELAIRLSQMDATAS